MNSHVASVASRRDGRAMGLLTATTKYLIGIVLCLHPITALFVLGWLTRRMQGQITALKGSRTVSRWPGFIALADVDEAGWFRRWFGGLTANVKAGAKALTAVLVYSLPFSALWYFGWLAGWENSFSKGYEQASFWPIVSFGAAVVSTPLLTLLPMAIAHQAAEDRIGAVLELRTHVKLFRCAPWKNLGLLLMIFVGFAALLGVRALPTFAEHMSQRVAGGDPNEIEAFLGEVRLVTTALLFTGLLVLRSVMARVYVAAQVRLANSGKGGVVGFAICFGSSIAIWLAIVFSIFLAQFLNYNWYSWLNQPILMLPWLGLPL